MHTLEKWKWGSGPGSCFSHFCLSPIQWGFSVPCLLHTPLTRQASLQPLLDPPSPGTHFYSPSLTRYTPTSQPHFCPYPCGRQHRPAQAVPSATGYAVLRPGTAGPLLEAQAGVPASGPGSGGYKGGCEPIWSPTLQPTPLSPAGQAPTFLSSRSWSKASTLRLCRGRADLQGREGDEGLQRRWWGSKGEVSGQTSPLRSRHGMGGAMGISGLKTSGDQEG